MRNEQPVSRPVHLFVLAVLLGCLGGCTYLHGWFKQTGYALEHAIRPSQHTLHHLLNQQSFYVYGRVTSDDPDSTAVARAVAAYCNRFRSDELIGVSHVSTTGTHFGLSLPEGEYKLLLMADLDQNQVFDQTEVVGKQVVSVDSSLHPSRVRNLGDIEVSAAQTIGWPVSISVPSAPPAQESVFFPAGTIRSLDEPLFDASMSSLGVYEPAAFMDIAPTMFYALEEDSYKMPVIFVHGMGGSAREFVHLVEHVDRQRFQPWFFFYPSGADLDQLADLFYDIFLSGRVIDRGETPSVVIAHSMGGLVVREALNRHHHAKQKNRVALFISLATPFGGHPAAAHGVRNAPMVIPSWHDLDPNSQFIRQLFRQPLGGVDHVLLYAQGAGSGDGVVPLVSQRRASALVQSAKQAGFYTSHTGVLSDPDVLAFVGQLLVEVEDVYPPDHLHMLKQGGFEVALSPSYNEREKYFIRTRGKYLQSIVTGSLHHMGSEVLMHFLNVVRGEAAPSNDAESAWVKFAEDYPELALQQGG